MTTPTPAEQALQSVYDEIAGMPQADETTISRDFVERAEVLEIINSKSILIGNTEHPIADAPGQDDPAYKMLLDSVRELTLLLQTRTLGVAGNASRVMAHGQPDMVNLVTAVLAHNATGQLDSQIEKELREILSNCAAVYTDVLARLPLDRLRIENGLSDLSDAVSLLSGNDEQIRITLRDRESGDEVSDVGLSEAERGYARGETGGAMAAALERMADTLDAIYKRIPSTPSGIR